MPKPFDRQIDRCGRERSPAVPSGMGSICLARVQAPLFCCCTGSARADGVWYQAEQDSARQMTRISAAEMIDPVAPPRAL
jgi:hypothetical protein